MVNINCSLDCIYQNEGKCTLKEIPSKQKYSYNANKDCIYYINNNEGKDLIPKS